MIQDYNSCKSNNERMMTDPDIDRSNYNQTQEMNLNNDLLKNSTPRFKSERNNSSNSINTAYVQL